MWLFSTSHILVVSQYEKPDITDISIITDISLGLPKSDSDTSSSCRVSPRLHYSAP